VIPLGLQEDDESYSAKNPLRRASADSVRSSKTLIVRVIEVQAQEVPFSESEVESRVRTFSSVICCASFPNRKAPAKIEANPFQFISLFFAESVDISSVRIRFDQSSDILDVSPVMPIKPSKEFEDHESR
jgi:hypothetical protein